MKDMMLLWLLNDFLVRIEPELMKSMNSLQNDIKNSLIRGPTRNLYLLY